MNPDFASLIFVIGCLLLVGLFFGLIASRFRFPRVVAYILAGVLFSPDLLGGVLSIKVGNWSDSLTSISLGIIAYLIGGSMTIAQLKRVGKQILGSALGESLGAAILVFVTVLLFAPSVAGIPSWVLALGLASIATTTAPAGTVAVLHQYRAKGALTTTLLGVVAVDDALGIIFFSLALMITGAESFTDGAVAVLQEIGGGLLLGFFAGYILIKLGRMIKQSNLRLPVTLGVILLSVGASEMFHLSPLLACMALGFSTRNFSRSAGDRMFAPIEYFEELVFILFFTLAGAHFDFSLFYQNLYLVSLYLFARVIGKAIGAYVGSSLAGAPTQVRKNLGFCLLPQAGVAIGLALTLVHQPAFAKGGVILLNVILASTILYAMLGPLFTRYALFNAGEIGKRRGGES